MSHFTNIKTRFQNLFYLEKGLQKLNINYKYKETSNSELGNIDLVIPQSKGYDITFVWNVHEYELVADMSFWDQPYPVETFIDKIAQKYADEVIIGESQKIGFEPTKFEENIDGSNTLILERWKSI